MVKRPAFIYLLLDIHGMKGYVGKTVYPNIRPYKHWKDRFKKDYYKHRWLRTLSFHPQVIILEKCTEKNWENKEKGWIRDLRLGGLKLTNLTEGGDGVVGNTLTEESKQKLRIANLGRRLSDDHKRKISKSLIGNSRAVGNLHTKDWKERMSKRMKGIKPWNTGKTLSKEHKRNIGEGGKGKVISEESRRKISISATGRVMSKQTREKISIAKKGSTLSEEHKKNISNSMREYYGGVA